MIVIHGSDVKPIHASIIIGPDNSVKIMDSGRVGFMIINGERKENNNGWVLKHNDQITIGQTVLRIEIV